MYKIQKITCSHDIYDETLFIEKKFNNWYGLSRDKKPENYIWDEDLTVRQNKEQTAKYNAEIDAEIEKRKHEYSEANKALREAIIDYIVDDCKIYNISCSRAQAEVIWNYCETQHEDDPHNYIDDVIELFEKLMEADK